MDTSKEKIKRYQVKKIICLYVFLYFSPLVHAQNTFAVWQGFSHYWTYNHRLNRLGDFIAQSSGEENKACTLMHTAATGLGKDSATFQSRFAIVIAPDISFFAGKINFHLQ